MTPSWERELLVPPTLVCSLLWNDIAENPQANLYANSKLPKGDTELKRSALLTGLQQLSCTGVAWCLSDLFHMPSVSSPFKFYQVEGRGIAEMHCEASQAS